MRGRKGRAAVGLVIGAVMAGAVVVAVAIFLRKGPALPKEYTYDLTELRKVDPKLILFQPTWRIHSGLQDAHAVAVGADGRIYLAGDQAIRILPPEAAEKEPDPAQIRTIQTTAAPRCLAVAEDGTVYVGAADHVEVYDAKGKLKASWPAPAEKALLTSIALGEEDVFAADAANHVVLRYDRSGKLTGRIGKRDVGRNIPGLIARGPYLDLAVAGDGLLRVVNPGLLRIEAYTRDGDLEVWWGEASPDISGFAGCCNPVSFAILPGGGFVTCEKGIRRVKLYDADGRFVGVVAGPDSFADAAAPGPGRQPAGELDVAADAKGRVFVLDPYTAELKVFARKAKAD